MGVSLRSSAATSTPYFLAKPTAAGVGCAVRLERGRHRRPGDQLLEVGLPLGELGDARRQPPRRAVALGGRVGRQPELLETRVEVRGELRGQAGQPARRNLLAADLDQQLAIHQLDAYGSAPPVSADRR